MRNATLIVTLLFVGCGGSMHNPTAVESVTENVSLPPLAPIPAYFEGFFVRGFEADQPPGNMHILLASWGDNMGLTRVPVFLSVHCCMWTGGQFDTTNWDRIQELWIGPLRDSGMLAGIYLVDEPEGHGISHDEVARGAKFFAQRGYPTMAASVSRHESRLPVDYW